MKRILLLVILFINFQYAYCQKVDDELARSVASSFYQSLTSGSNLKVKSAKSIQLHRVNLNLSADPKLKSSNVDSMFVYNVGNNEGFVVVSGFIETKPIFAFSTKGEFPEDRNHPIYLLLNNTLKNIGNISGDIPNKEWGNISLKSSTIDRNYLISTTWGQSIPFASQISNEASQYVPIGCTATALAQIINYYKYPFESRESWYDEGGEDPKIGFLTTINRPINYLKFQDFYPIDPNNAFPEDGIHYFLNDVAVALETDFGTDGSEAYLEHILKKDAREVLEEEYLYSSTTFNSGSNWDMNQEKWKNIIKTEIENQHPVLIGSIDGDGGGKHAFICDGYDQEDYFHFNFGWNGDGDCWYLIDDINVIIPKTDETHDYSYKFIRDQTMITGIAPDLLKVQEDSYEDDNSFETASNIEITTSDAITQLHSIATIADKDYYTFTLTTTSDVTIETKGVNGNTQIWLYNESKSYLDYDDDSSNEGNGNAKLTIELPAGKYYFMIDEKGNDRTIPSYIVSFSSISIGTRNISYRDHIVKDGTDDGGVGDGDGKAESGEEIELDVELFNSGNTNAQDVKATLSTNDPDITITDNTLSWGRINPEEGDWSSDFEFKVSYSCPSKNVTFTLKITSNEGEWTDNFIIPVYNVPTVYIPDANFEQALIDEEIDTDGIINKQILISDAESVDDDLRLENRNISSLTGIGAFKNIQRLYCEGNQITELDISNNKDLYYLHCVGNQLTELDVSKNTNLTKIKCASNQIEILDVRNNTKLDYLSCSGNPITSLDVSANTALTILNCNGTQLRSLNLKNNLNLIDLGCDGNKLENLDISKNTKLTNLECDDNLLTSLDLSKNNSLIELWCRRNQLTDIIFSQNSTLTILECESNKLTSLDISKNSALIEVDCSLNELVSLDASNNHNLTDLICETNELFYLDMRNGIIPDDIDLRAEFNNLTCINVDDENHSNLDSWDVDDGVVFSEDCPKDLDADGVLDDVDLCPNTPFGDTSDDNGCSESQLDDDADGVMNNLDDCPDTPTGETVNSEGCSESQLDDDADTNHKPNKPVLISPSNDSTVSLPFNLTWTATDDDGDNLTSFKIYKGTSSGNMTEWKTSYTKSYNVSSLSAGTYYWCVRSYDGNLWSDPSGYRKFTIASTPANQKPNKPTLTSPGNDSTVSLPFNLTWTATDDDGDNLTSFKIYKGTSSGNMTEWKTSYTKSYNVSSLSAGTYYWCVKSYDGKLWSDYSSYRKFTISSTSTNHRPNKPSLTGPGNGSTVSLPFNLTWTATDDDGDNLTSFKIYKGTSSGNMTEWKTSYTKSYNVSSLSAGTYYWCVKSYDGKLWSDYSSYRKFTVPSTSTNKPPDAPVLTSPTNGATVSSPFTLTWTCNDDDDANNSLTYRIYKGTSASNMNLLTTSSTESITANYMSDGTYYWRVKASDGKSWSGYSDVFKFTVSSTNTNHYPNKPILISPPNGSVFKIGESFHYEASGTDDDGDPLKYQFYEKYGSKDWHLWEERSSSTSTNFSWITPKTVQWKVRTMDSDGLLSEFSDTWTYTVIDGEENTPPDKPVITSPAYGQILTVPFTISWTCSDLDGDPLTYIISISRSQLGLVTAQKHETSKNSMTLHFTNSDYDYTGDWYCHVIATDGKDTITSDSRKFQLDWAVGIEDILINKQIKIYPNPTNQYLNIEFATTPGKYNYGLYNNLGQCILQKESGNRLEQIDLSGTTSGIYYLKIYNKDFLKTEKIIVR